MIKLEYIWIDGTKPTAQLRSKTKVVEEFDRSISGPTGCPMWSFDGSSTNQAPGDKSDCVLQPVSLYENPLEHNCYLVLCEVFNTDETPHKTNHRFELEQLNSKHSEKDVWVGIEQEYTLYEDGRPLGWPGDGEPAPQGDYYCGRNKGESIAREHMDACIKANIKISGINSEVMLGQWEYQIGADNPVRISDDLWIARWLMEKLCDKYNVVVTLDPKPVEGDWNGAGAHTNFSTFDMREDKGVDEIFKSIKKLEQKHYEHIKVYGDGNERRLTGKYETCDINTFRWGVSDRGASIRVPWQVSVDGKGYLEDRRPSANCDPYLVCHKLIETICGK
jgi:glutamine synthetase